MKGKSVRRVFNTRTGFILQEGTLLIEVFDADSPDREKTVTDKIESLLKKGEL